ncbi:MAG TPA: response regulator [Bryobacteraceae bacterium]|nr:response regulator [Bryobacteraceae bacterium]
MSPSKFQILLIEDTESDAHLFETALREAAPRVKLYWVASAAEGIEYLRQENRFHDVGPISLIVCDLNMPGTDGYGFLEKVKQDPSLNRIPLVVYSSSSSLRDIQACYALGANSYIVKPMTIERMVQQLKALVHYWLEIVSLPGTLVLD